MSEGKAKQLSTRRVYAGRVVKVDLDTVKLPNGEAVELEMIRHSGASAIVPFLSDPASYDPQILLVRQYRHAAGGFIYEIPAGKLDPGEEPLACATRELLEETGCTAQSIEHVYTFLTTPGFTDEKIHAFMATGLTRGEQKLQRDEVMTTEMVAMSRAMEMIRKGEIIDAKTALSILFVAGFKLGH
ncbi:MAG TPA: NUDIX hydrolase [Gemmatimonadaceae bacterium]